MNKLRIGHIGWLSNDEGVDHTTVAWCDTNEQRLHDLKLKHPHMLMFTDYREMLRCADLDLVVIATPNWLHHQMASECLRAGKHVFLEKPMAVKRDEMEDLVADAARSGKHLAIDFEMRISPFASRIQEILGTGEIGGLRRMEFIHHRGGWLESGNGIWRTKHAKSGGIFLMEIIHSIDLFRFLAGEVVAVQATSGPNVFDHYEFPDNACLQLHFQNGSHGVILSSHTLSAQDAAPTEWPQRGHDMNMIFTCSGGSIAVDFLRCRILVNRYEKYPLGTSGVRAVFDRVEDFSRLGSHFFHDIDLMRREFIRRCANNEKPFQTIDDAWKTHLVCLAAEESLASNSRVSL